MDSITYSDYYLLANDFADYLATQQRVDAVYRDPAAWAKMSIMSTAGSGFFSSDRTIAEVGGEKGEEAGGEGKAEGWRGRAAGEGDRRKGPERKGRAGGKSVHVCVLGLAVSGARTSSTSLPPAIASTAADGNAFPPACCTAAVQQGHLEVEAVPSPHPQQR